MTDEVQGFLLEALASLRAVRDQLSVEYTLRETLNVFVPPASLSAVQERLANLPGITVSLVQRAGTVRMENQQTGNSGMRNIANWVQFHFINYVFSFSDQVGVYVTGDRVRTPAEMTEVRQEANLPGSNADPINKDGMPSVMVCVMKEPEPGPSTSRDPQPGPSTSQDPQPGPSWMQDPLPGPSWREDPQPGPDSCDLVTEATSMVGQLTREAGKRAYMASLREENQPHNRGRYRDLSDQPKRRKTEENGQKQETSTSNPQNEDEDSDDGNNPPPAKKWRHDELRKRSAGEEGDDGDDAISLAVVMDRIPMCTCDHLKL